MYRREWWGEGGLPKVTGGKKGVRENGRECMYGKSKLRKVWEEEWKRKGETAGMERIVWGESRVETTKKTVRCE